MFLVSENVHREFTQFVRCVLVLRLQHGLQLGALQQVALQLRHHLPDLLQQLGGGGVVGHGLQGEGAVFFYLSAQKYRHLVLLPVPIWQLWPVESHQVAKVAEGVPGQLHDALREAALVADEAGDDGGQAVPGPVQHDGGGGSPHHDFGAAALREATGEK